VIVTGWPVWGSVSVNVPAGQRRLARVHPVLGDVRFEDDLTVLGADDVDPERHDRGVARHQMGSVEPAGTRKRHGDLGAVGALERAHEAVAAMARLRRRRRGAECKHSDRAEQSDEHPASCWKSLLRE
jgi:hypothetical protein